jgi:hypothetical protein
MMTSMTETIALREEDGWVDIASGMKFILIQLTSSGRIQLYLQGDGNVPPDIENDEQASIQLARGIVGVESSFSAGGLPENTTLWLRAIKGTETVNAVAY